MAFEHFDLRIVSPPFEDPITASIVVLEGLRRQIRTTTPPELFIGLKSIFQTIESLASARVEGNNTTITDLVDLRARGIQSADEKQLEIANIESAIRFIDDNLNPGDAITHNIVREIHRIVVDGLTPPPDGEGDHTPGEYRTDNVSIAGSQHTPPLGVDVHRYASELIDFINYEDQSQFSLIRIALTHHRFCWAHPFTNGNGRVTRAVTFALLKKYGYNADRINPTAVFAANRDMYYRKLAAADRGTDDGLLEWCRYVFDGWQREVERIERLADYDYLKRRVLKPAIRNTARAGDISSYEKETLLLAVEKRFIAAKDVASIMPEVTKVTVSRRITKMRERKLLIGYQPKPRHYRVKVVNNLLMPNIVRQLRNEGFFEGLE